MSNYTSKLNASVIGDKVQIRAPTITHFLTATEAKALGQQLIDLSEMVKSPGEEHIGLLQSWLRSKKNQ